MLIGLLRHFKKKRVFCSLPGLSTKNVMRSKKKERKEKKNVFLAHHSDMFDGGEKKWN